MHHHGHSHDHHPDAAGAKLWISIVLNIGITVAQIVGGIISGSLALISDALHNFSDVLSLAISLIARKLSRRSATEKFTFGYKRAEVLAAFINSATLIIVAVYLMYESVMRFISPVAIQSGWVIWLSILGIVFNGLSTLLLKNEAAQSANMRSAYLHLLSDTLASVAVLVCGLLMKYYGWFQADSIVTFMIAVYLIVLSFDLLRSTTKMLMLFTPENLEISNITEKIHSIIGENRLFHIHLWHLNDNELHFEAHLDCTSDMTISEFSGEVRRIEKMLHDEFHITHCTIQPDYGLKGDKDIIMKE